MVKYEDMKKILAAGAGRIEETHTTNQEMTLKILILHDNAEVWFYFDIHDELYLVRSYP